MLFLQRTYVSKGLVKKVFAVFSGDCMTVDLESLLLKASLCEKAEDKVLSLLEACFDLISGSSHHMKIQIMGEKITENLGFKTPLWKDKKNFFSFSNSP